MRRISTLILVMLLARQSFAKDHLNSTLSDCLSGDSVLCDNSNTNSITVPHVTQERRWWCALKRPFVAKSINTIVANVEVTLRQTSQSPVALFRFDNFHSAMLGGSYTPVTVINPDLENYAESIAYRNIASESLEGAVAVGEVRPDFASLDLRHQAGRLSRTKSPLRFSFDAKTKQLILREGGRIADVVSCDEQSYPAPAAGSKTP